MKTFVGLVVRTKNAKTAHVEINTEWMHPKYLKKVKQSKVFACQDNFGVKVGDEVEIAECKRLSATKYFTITRVTKEKFVHEVKVEAVKPEVKVEKKATKSVKKTVAKK